MVLTSYGDPLDLVTSFKYLGQVIVEEDDNWPVVVRNLQLARQKLALLTPVLSREGADAQTLGQIYLTVVQLVMLYGPESWVLTPRMKMVLGGFYHRVA